MMPDQLPHIDAQAHDAGSPRPADPPRIDQPTPDGQPSAAASVRPADWRRELFHQALAAVLMVANFAAMLYSAKMLIVLFYSPLMDGKQMPASGLLFMGGIGLLIQVPLLIVSLLVAASRPRGCMSLAWPALWAIITALIGNAVALGAALYGR